MEISKRKTSKARTNEKFEESVSEWLKRNKKIIRNARGVEEDQNGGPVTSSVSDTSIFLVSEVSRGKGTQEREK